MNKYRRKTNKTKGFTLLEVVITLGLFLIISTTTLSLLSYSSLENRNLTSKYNTYTNNVVSMDFITKYIQQYSEFDLIYKSGEFSILKIYTTENRDSKSAYIISFSRNKINFGGISSSGTSYTNELSTNVDSMSVDLDLEHNLLTVIIKTSDPRTSKETTLTSVLDVSGKNFK